MKKLPYILLAGLALGLFSLPFSAQQQNFGGGSLIAYGGYSSATPTGTQQFGATYRSTIGAGSTNATVVPRQITVTGIAASVTAAEGAAATMSFTVATCTTTGCTAFTNTAVTCTIGFSSSVCSGSGFGAVINAGQLIVIQTVQTGTGTAAVGSASITYN